MSDVAKKIVGTWKLVYSVEINEKGNKYFPFADDAIGFIIYDAVGNMAVQISRKQRKNFQSKVFRNATAEELKEIPQDYLAYFGSYEIDLKNELVRHYVKGALFPGYIDKVLDRKYRFFDDKMSLKPWDGTDREILWQKVSS
jgi:catechol 1,2-dioxygenase